MLPLAVIVLAGLSAVAVLPHDASAVLMCVNPQCSQPIALVRTLKEHFHDGRVLFPENVALSVYSKDDNIWEGEVCGMWMWM